jgi:hypothetical protein
MLVNHKYMPVKTAHVQPDCTDTILVYMPGWPKWWAKFSPSDSDAHLSQSKNWAKPRNLGQPYIWHSPSEGSELGLDLSEEVVDRLGHLRATGGLGHHHTDCPASLKYGKVFSTTMIVVQAAQQLLYER